MTYEPAPEQPSPWIRVSKIVATIGLVVLAGVAVVGGGSYLGRLVGSTFNSDDPSASPVSVQPGQDVTIEIPSGSTAEDIGAILAAQGVVRSALEFEVAVRNNEADARLQAGTYGMQTVMDPNEVVAMLVVGPVADVYRATVIEGLKVEEILTALAEASGLPYADFETALLSGDVETSLAQMPAEPTLARLGRPALPGYL